MNIRIATALAIVAGAGAAATANADVIANWTFEASIPATAGPFAAEAGANAAGSFALGSHVGAAVYSNPVGNGSVESFSSNTWAIGDYYQFSTSTAGYSGITIGWDQTSSGTGPRDFALQWSTDGVSFSSLSSYSVLVNGAPNTPWSSVTYNPLFTFAPVAAPAGADNQATLYFRLAMATNVSANGSVVAAAGTDRVDNIVISGVIPAPSALALLGLGGLVASRRRRA